LRPLRLRCEPSAPECHSGTPSAHAVSHDCGGLLHARGAGLLHPAADHGVRLVAGLTLVLAPRFPSASRSRRSVAWSGERTLRCWVVRRQPAGGWHPGSQWAKAHCERRTEDRAVSIAGEARARVPRPLPVVGGDDTNHRPESVSWWAVRWLASGALPPRLPCAFAAGGALAVPVAGFDWGGHLRRSEDRACADDDRAEAWRRPVPTFSQCRAEALLREVGAACRSVERLRAPACSRALPSGAVTLRSFPLVHSRATSP